MKRPTMLYRALVEEILRQHDLSASKDLQTIEGRIGKEGDGFLAISLPRLGSALETGLERGFITRSDCPSFGHDRRGTLPRLFKGLFMKIFHSDGRLKDQPDCDAIFALRQVCFWSKKPKALASNARNKAALRRFRSIEEELEAFGRICSESDPILERVSNILWTDIFSDISTTTFDCRHGPGVTAERKSANSRFQLTHWNRRSEECFPADVYAIKNFGDYAELENIHFLSEDEEIPVRITLVPKTMKTPRIIAIEPSHVMYMQQGLMNYVTKNIESHRLTRGSIRFRDQSANRDSARCASLNRKRATLDLSDASDRVHNALVNNVFKNSPILDYLQACRSSHAILPDDKTPLKLRKFASMGSAMCFPVEAMVFYTVIQVALHYLSGITPTHASIARYSRDIEIYGDDIIVPAYSQRIVRTALEAYGLRVNENKSFFKGYFRESCGGDYYKGVDVTPVYLRYQLPAKMDHSVANEVMSLVETSNQLYKKGLWTTSQLLRDQIEKICGRTIPRSPYSGDGLAFYSRLFTTKCRWKHDIQAFAQKRIAFVPKKDKDACSDIGKFFKKFLSVSDTPLDSGLKVLVELDFSRSVKRGAFKVKPRWVPATIGRFVD